MSKFTVDSFIVELGFNENVIKGLQKLKRQLCSQHKELNVI